MLTLHVAPLLRLTAGGEAVPDGAVLVDGGRVVAVGPMDEVAAAHPDARVRRWRGTIGPGLVADGVRVFLEETYHEDPQDPDRPHDRAESVRRGIHELLSRGVTGVVDDLTDAAVRSAVDHTGLLRLWPGTTSPGLAPGGRADLAVLATDGSCVATVLAGRLVHRRA
ncbi:MULTISPECIES: imidazolonepropionase-like domain-containing protein [unclassified Streptomyces]|uniref:imidazolonepropionase-like domain-containing protein n=1 Tax=unclassified Streptomyces TaxID=2593676 RepID=UPI0036E83F55